MQCTILICGASEVDNIHLQSYYVCLLTNSLLLLILPIFTQ